jgi:hypothetical protein
VGVAGISPDGRFAVGASHRGLAAWELPTGRLLWEAGLPKESGRLRHLLFTRDARLVVLHTEDGTLRAWETRTGRLVMRYEIPIALCLSQLTPDGRLVCGTWEGQVLFFTLRDPGAGPPAVTAVRMFHLAPEPGAAYSEGGPIPGRYEDEMTAGCPWCNRRFAAPGEVLDRVAGMARDAGLSAGEPACLRLPAEAWDDPRLIAECAHCGKPVRFTPFAVEPE